MFLDHWRRCDLRISVALGAMPRLALVDHFSTDNIEGRKQSGGSVSNIIVSYSFNVAQSHRQDRLGSFQRLALAFFVHAQNQCVLWWIKVKANDIADFFDEERIVR